MSRRHPRLLAVGIAGLIVGAVQVRAEEADHGKRGEAKRLSEHCSTDAAAKAASAGKEKGAAGAAAKVTVVDRALQNQDGATVRFGRDVVGGDIVVMDFVFTTCTTICPILSAKFARIQEQLGDRLGKGVKLVSVSLDPVRDTPARLKAYGAKFKAGPGWSFLTGAKDDVDEVLKGLGAYVPNFQDHPPMVLVGDGKTGRWVRVNGFPDPKNILATVDQIASGRRVAAAAGGGS
jgi:cytochrome oxidase Cu insertion factor (SCO1/SenC/PrrC family)